MSVNLDVVKRLGNAGVMYVSCLVEKCVFELFMGMWLVIVLCIQLFRNWYLFLWRGREAEAVLLFINVSNPSPIIVFGVPWWCVLCLLVIVLFVWLLFLLCCINGLCIVCVVVVCAFSGVLLIVVLISFN